MQSRLQLATFAMGTRFEIVIDNVARADPYAARRGSEVAPHDPELARAAGEAAVAEIERLHRQLSRFAPDSLLSHVNRTAFSAPVRVDASTFALLADACTVYSESKGAFDITRGSGMDGVLLDRDKRSVRFAADGISIDLGGIAKGHAVDRAAAILREHGITSALVHGGTSSVAAVGTPLDESAGWKVGIASSLETGRPSRHVVLCDDTLSVSSGATREHIVDPVTGAFITGPRTAAVIGPSATLGDAWATAIAVTGVRPAGLGPEWTTIIE